MARKTRERSATRTGSGRSRTGTETQASKTAQHIGSVPLNPEKLKRLYSTMLKCRMLEEKVCGLSKQGKFIGSHCAVIGGEATEVGAIIDLLSEDFIALSDRDFIVSFIKGAPLKLIFARLRALQISVNQGNTAPARNGRAQLKIIAPASSIKVQIDIAAGVALAYKMQKRPFVTVAFCGEGAASLGLWHEAMHLPGARKLPIVFVIENSSCAESAVTTRRNADEDLSMKALAYGLPGITVDGNDVVAVYRVAQEAIRRAREGHGPALIECKTCRWPGYSQVPSAGHRSAEEAEDWKSKDPILFMENYLKRKDLWSDEWKQNMVQGFNQEMDEAVTLAQSPHLKPAPVRSFEIFEGELNRKPIEVKGPHPIPLNFGKS